MQGVNTLNPDKELIGSQISGKNQSLSESQTHHCAFGALARYYNKAELVEKCLQSLDIFKNILEEDEHMRKKLILDVKNNIQIDQYRTQNVLYNQGDEALEIFLVLGGSVGLYYSKLKPKTVAPTIYHEEDLQEEVKDNAENYAQIQVCQPAIQEIQTIVKGNGFGEAQFISQKRRKLRAIIKEDTTIIGKINGASFNQIIDNYRNRVYERKFQMFAKCPLFQKVPRSRLELIVGHSKPIEFQLNQQLAKEGENLKYLILINKGTAQCSKVLSHADGSIPSAQKNQGFELKRLLLNVIEEGSFLGDLQIARNQNFQYDAYCKSQKMETYCCDVRMINSQILECIQGQPLLYYHRKQKFYSHKISNFGQLSLSLKSRVEFSSPVKLKPHELAIKKQINHRYIGKKHSFLNELSPREIQRMVCKKNQRLERHHISQPRYFLSLPTADSIKKDLNNRKKLFKFRFKTFKTEQQTIVEPKGQQTNSENHPRLGRCFTQFADLVKKNHKCSLIQKNRIIATNSCEKMQQQNQGSKEIQDIEKQMIVQSACEHQTLPYLKPYTNRMKSLKREQTILQQLRSQRSSVGSPKKHMILPPHCKKSGFRFERLQQLLNQQEKGKVS